LLNPGGAYLVICPDRRFTFDAHRPDSTIGQVVEAHELNRKRHSIATLIDDHVYRTHNEGLRHWRGDSPPLERFSPQDVRAALELWRHSERTGEYVDRHGWIFTPVSFQLIALCLYDAAYTDLKPQRVFETPNQGGEFIAVFVKA
jgi:hypothetical protein